MLAKNIELGEFLLQYDPLRPDPRLFSTATAFALAKAKPRLPEPVPWPTGFAPQATQISPAPGSGARLPKVDALVVTWTVAEARALATLFTPGFQLESWHEYKRNVSSFIPKVTGRRAPFNSRSKYTTRYYHVLGLYSLCQIGRARVLCFKSGLHLDYDGPQVPVRDLWEQIVDESGAELVVTTGTGGGIGANIKLGDVVVGSATRFRCVRQFANKPFAEASYDTSELPKDAFRAVTKKMLKPNGDKLLEENPKPLKLVVPGSRIAKKPVVVTTDFFAYDDTKNTNKLQGLGQACDMGDAVLGLVMKGRGAPKWTAIRNASDGQIDATKPSSEAGKIYMKYGVYTTAGSIIATWAAIKAMVPAAAKPGPRAKGAAKKAQLTMAAAPRPPAPDANTLFLALAAGSNVKTKDVGASDLDQESAALLREELASAGGPKNTTLTYRRVSFVDETGDDHQMFLVQAQGASDSPFRASFLLEEGELVAKSIVGVDKK